MMCLSLLETMNLIMWTSVLIPPIQNRILYPTIFHLAVSLMATGLCFKQPQVGKYLHHLNLALTTFIQELISLKEANY